MKLLNYALIAMLLVISSMAQAAKNAPKVLMVVSSHGIDKGETQPGYEFDEYAKAYLVFRDNGLAIDVASPKGGAVEADQYNTGKAYNKAVLADKTAMAKLANTLKIADLDAGDYQAIFVVGGKGAMFDLPKDEALKQLIANIYQQQGTVSAVCHGPAALVDVKLANGEYLVAGKAVNGFTNAEEQAFGKKWAPHFEFMLEDRLKERGGRFENAPMMLNHVAIDGRLITGQNPFSTTAAAEAVVRSLGLTPVEREPFKDDATIALVPALLAGDASAAKQLKAQGERYQPELIAMYGYYRMMFAKVDKDREQAIALMELTRDAVDSPQLPLAIAKGYQQLGQLDKARKEVTAVLASHPDMKAAKALLKSLNNS